MHVQVCALPLLMRVCVQLPTWSMHVQPSASSNNQQPSPVAAGRSSNRRQIPPTPAAGASLSDCTHCAKLTQISQG